jgi:hypothetical protein
MENKFKEIRDYFDETGRITGFNLEWLITQAEKTERYKDALKSIKHHVADKRIAYSVYEYIRQTLLEEENQ